MGFGKKMKKVWDVGFSGKRSGNVGSGCPLPDSTPASNLPQDWDKFPGGEGGDSAYERVGMLVVSLRGVNFRFWSHLVCSGQNAIIFSREGLV